MQAPSAPSTRRVFQQIPALNSALSDHYNEQQVRICMPIYLDLSTVQRKELLNGVRNAMRPTVSNSSGLSEISVQTASDNGVEAYLGITFENLRNVIFQRGGIPIDLVMKLQSVTGIEFVSFKDMQAAFKHRQTVIKDWLAEHSYE